MYATWTFNDTVVLNDHAEHYTLFTPKSTIIIGFSGGPDSVFLLDYLCAHRAAYDIKLIAAHLNHGWRTSTIDEGAWCMNEARIRGIECVTAHARDYTLPEDARRGSQEARGRTLRRRFFAHVAQDYTAQTITLAHHRDDLIETTLVRAIRGSGLMGLAAIRPVSVETRTQLRYVRPLLPITKADILGYLDSNQIPYLIDPTNSDQQYLRNRIRQQVVPTLAACDARASENLYRSIMHLQDAAQWATDTLRAHLASHIMTDSSGIEWLPTQVITDAAPFAQHELLHLWLQRSGVTLTQSEALTQEVIRFLSRTTTGSHVIGRITLVVRKALMTIALSEH